MKCPTCGFEDDGRFCKQCGAPMVTDKKAEWLGVPQFTGITVSPPTASQGLRVEDMEELGLHDVDPHMATPEGPGRPEEGNSFSAFLIMAFVVALILFGFLMFRQAGTG